MDGSTQSTRTSLVDQLGLVGGSVRLHMGVLFLTKIPQFDQAPFIDPPSPSPPTHTYMYLSFSLSLRMMLSSTAVRGMGRRYGRQR